MNRRTNLLALLLAAVMVLTLAGCGNSVNPEEITWAVKLGDEELPAGVYNSYLMAGYQDAATKMGEVKYDNLLRQTIDGEPAQSYIVNYAKAESEKMLVLRKRYSDLGLTMDVGKSTEAVGYATYLYSMNSDYYRVNHMSEDDIKYVYESSQMVEDIFYSIYGKGGEKEVPQTELMATLEKDYTRSQFMVFPKFDQTTSETFDDAAIEALRLQAEDFFARAQVEDQSFTDLVYELDLSRQTDDAAPLEKYEEYQYDMFLKHNGGYYPETYESYVVTAAVGSIQLLEDDQYFYIIKKLPVAEAEEAAMETPLKDILSDLKYEEFVAEMETWTDGQDFIYNNEALNFFTPKNLKTTAEAIQLALLEEERAGKSPQSDSSSESSEEEGSEESSGEGSESSSA